jgi:antitoxin (DNA-binding transcriptional repressor) of toxin-antitoxin stability system
MDKITVSIAEGKKGFSRLISKAGEAGEDVIVTRRG